MAYQSLNGSSKESPTAIYLYTTPLRKSGPLKLKKPADIFAHWAICIQGRCYELVRNTTRTKDEPEYNVRFSSEQEWEQRKEDEHRVLRKRYAGKLSMPYPRETIEEVGAYNSPG